MNKIILLISVVFTSLILSACATIDCGSSCSNNNTVAYNPGCNGCTNYTNVNYNRGCGVCKNYKTVKYNTGCGGCGNYNAVVYDSGYINGCGNYNTGCGANVNYYNTNSCCNGDGYVRTVY